MIRSMPRRNPRRLHIHLAFTYSVGPSSVVGSELGPAPPFPPTRVLEVQWPRALSLVCEVARWRMRRSRAFNLVWEVALIAHVGVHMVDSGFSKVHLSYLIMYICRETKKSRLK
jgi:hypothetical protein